MSVVCTVPTRTPEGGEECGRRGMVGFTCAAA